MRVSQQNPAPVRSPDDRRGVLRYISKAKRSCLSSACGRPDVIGEGRFLRHPEKKSGTGYWRLRLHPRHGANNPKDIGYNTSLRWKVTTPPYCSMVSSLSRETISLWLQGLGVGQRRMACILSQRGIRAQTLRCAVRPATGEGPIRRGPRHVGRRFEEYVRKDAGTSATHLISGELLTCARTPLHFPPAPFRQLLFHTVGG
jgi:hypothetical protein